MGPTRHEPMTNRARPLLHVAQISFFNDPQGRGPSQLLEAWATLVDVAEAASRSGVRVSVVQASAHSEQLQRDGVGYYFLPFGEHSGVADQVAVRELLCDLAPDVVHVHGLNFPRDVLSLAAHVPDIPIILQDHASRPPRLWRRALWRRALSVAGGIAFCAREQAQPFASAGLVHAHTRVYEVPESTSRFTPGDREEARHLTNIRGEPAILWVGHLDANKDPLAVLDGVSAAVPALPRLQLFCCFGVAPLLRAVQERIASDSCLRERVTLLGRVPHERVEQLMRAADIFVLGSHREGSGYSLIEALACGLPPVVTDIPSFRSLTAAGAVGALWPCGDSRALCEALQSVAARADRGMRAAVRAHFDRELSFAALGAKLSAMYEDVVERKRRAALATRPSTSEVQTS
jgi:glycosyltransferase involved in cell wall biosynthesis